MSGRLTVPTRIGFTTNSRLWVIALIAGIASGGAARAGSPPSSSEATSSSTARREAIDSIPYVKLDADSKAKVDSVLNNVAVFRRLPTRSVNCDPDFYLFLVRHPDVLVNVWELLGVAQLQLRQIDVDHYRIVETEGTTASFQYLYHTYNTHIVFGEWTYTGPLLNRKISGRCLGIMKSTYSRDKEGRYFITSRLDGFLSVDSTGAELLTRTLHPLVDKNIDNNFIQTVSFIGSLSKTAEVNTRGMEHMAARLAHVQSDTREQLNQVIAGTAERYKAHQIQKDLPAGPLPPLPAPPSVATRVELQK